MEQTNALEGQEALPLNSQVDEQPLPEPSPEPSPEKQDSMESLLQEEGPGLDFPKSGEIREGVIAGIGDTEILVSIGTKSEGVIPLRELDQIPSKERAELKVGKEVLVYVVNPEDPNGIVQLSYVRALEEQDWRQAESLLESGESYEGKIIGFNKGGLIVPLGHLRGFVPASQVSVLRRLDSSGTTPEQRWGVMVNAPISVRVIEVDRERRRLILSERSALQETRETLKERLLEELKPGDIKLGRVTSLADFGAFVNIEGADGLVHLSEVSWERIDHPKEVLKVGQEVRVKVIAVDQERKRIGLSIRQLLPDPWLKKIEGLREGQLIEGTITHLTKFGAFARLGEDLEGLIHISELSEQRVNHPKEVLHEGEVVTLRVIKIEPERRRIGLSVRKVDSPAYADLDWKTTLSGVVGESEEGEQPADEAAVEAEPPVDETAAEEEAPTAEVAEEEPPTAEVAEEEAPTAEVAEEEPPAAETAEEPVEQTPEAVGTIKAEE